ncbi:MAG: putative porin, partial [Sandaracinobacteroides sp.]
MLLSAQLLAGAPALAQAAAPMAMGEAAAQAPSRSFSENLVRLMVKRKLITEAEADELLAQAAADTRAAEQTAARAPLAVP